MVRSSEVLVKLKIEHCQLKILFTALHHNEMPIGVDHDDLAKTRELRLSCITMKCQ
jgi:hypothetical protein